MAPREIYVNQGGHRWPFSKGLVVESVVTAGGTPEAAAAVARAVEQHLLDVNLRDVTTRQLKEAMVSQAGALLGDALSDRLRAQTAAFEDIIVEGEAGTLPFSRGILARSLEDTGLAPREAYSVASRIDQHLRERGITHFAASDIDDLIERALSERYGEHLRLTYRFLRQNRGRLGVLETGGSTPVPFSKGILTQSLLAAGVAPDYARKVARAAQARLRGTEDRLVTRAHVSDVTEELLRQEIGPQVADRYRLLRVVRRPPKPLAILLGGVSGTGKSFLAAELAYRLGITRIISTDSVREVMRAMVSPALVPTLHMSSFDAWEALLDPAEPHPAHPSKAQLLAGFREQAQQVSVGVGAVVRRSLEENASLVLEGVHLAPGYLRASDFEGAIVIPMLVTVPDEAEHRRHFQARDRETTQTRPMSRYLRYFREIRQMQTYLTDLAGHVGVPTLNGLSLDEAADQAMEVIMSRVVTALPPEQRAAFTNV
ncbi:2-phosphoglycerate kinase [Deinococcus maricopensis]|uniref:2-phosphoglycerate kinase n=1 Tax=Deinococcus maricopensis (strain DSM 21211 / LMG 22137 / NRRL B-23946 / LB-34) TaxID=709986 RepID=E8UBI9_DEIML|nr:2-phosphoglycerate kinase [Deinococcus maricopensis]ADV68428.1 2-phosphoglycerate kinase [Deinococcus maricopensis DSM 21211]